MSLAQDLISFWELEEASGTRYDAHASNDLTDINTVLSDTGKVGDAADFVSTSDEYLEKTSVASLQFADEDFTLACWALYGPPAIGASVYNPLMTKATNTAATFEYQLTTGTNDKLQFRVSDGTTLTTVEASAACVALTWYFVVGWHDSDADKIYVQVNNGTPAEAAHSAGCQVSTNPFRLGAYYGSFGDHFMYGLIDQAGLWNRVLTSAERTLLYNGGSGLSYANLVGIPPAPSWF